MTQQPEALRLADVSRLSRHHEWHLQVDAELRRLHASCEDYAQHKQRQDQRVLELNAQRDALLEALKEADDLLRIARGALWKLGLNGLGSDTRLSHEVRMFALEFSAESRDGPGVLQVNGTGRALNALKSICAAIKAVEETK